MQNRDNTNPSPVQLSQYQKIWPQHFKVLEKAIIGACGDLIARIEHIGSTSIPGMSAKDIIDIQCGVSNFEQVESIKTQLAALGFQQIETIKQDHIPFHESNDFHPDWEKRFFKGSYQGISCNIHLRILGSANWKFAIYFRDYLIQHKEVATVYQQIKSRLSEAGVPLKTYAYIKDPVCDLIYLAFNK